MNPAMNPITYWIRVLGMALLGSRGESSNACYASFLHTLVNPGNLWTCSLGEERKTASKDQGQGPE